MLVAFVCAMGTQAQRSIEFRATVDPSVQSTPANGRLVVYLIDLDSDLSRAQPADGPFFSDPQPMFSVGVRGVPAGETIVVDDGAAFFPVMPSELSPGRYRAQAVLDQSRTNSSWRREEGNLFSEPVLFDVTEREQAQVVHLRLSQRVGSYESRSEEGVHPIAVQSRLLSTFRGHDVTLKATVIEPVDMEEGRRYPVVYEVPGFGGDHNRALWVGARMRSMPADSDIGSLARNAYWVVLDPEGPNGHHLFADSANNGPVSQALTRELIPAIDEAFQTIAAPSARLLRGHSSGGWSVIWLMLNWPDVFGGAWSSSPDPVDFSSFQAVDIYTEANMYRREDKSRDKANEIVWIPSYKDEHGNVGMTIRQENRMEEVLGPGNTSGQQWDSWLAVFGPRRTDGSPADLFDPRTGAIDRGVARQYEKYDIVRTLRSKRASYGPILKDRLRLIVGDMDNYDLDEAVKKLKTELDGLSFAGNRAYHGYITIVPGRDHSNIFETPEMEAIPGQMLEELERRGHIEKAATGEGE